MFCYRQFILVNMLSFLLLFPSIAVACSPPDMPQCISGAGGINTPPDYNICRSKIERYQNEGNRYLQCLFDDLNRAADEANRASQDYNRAVDRLNEANAVYEQHRQGYEHDTRIIQQNIDALFDYFNQLFG